MARNPRRKPAGKGTRRPGPAAGNTDGTSGHAGDVLAVPDEGSGHHSGHCVHDPIEGLLDTADLADHVHLDDLGAVAAAALTSAELLAQLHTIPLDVARKAVPPPHRVVKRVTPVHANAVLKAIRSTKEVRGWWPATHRLGSPLLVLFENHADWTLQEWARLLEPDRDLAGLFEDNPDVAGLLTSVATAGPGLLRVLLLAAYEADEVAAPLSLGWLVADWPDTDAGTAAHAAGQSLRAAWQQVVEHAAEHDVELPAAPRRLGEVLDAAVEHVLRHGDSGGMPWEHGAAAATDGSAPDDTDPEAAATAPTSQMDDSGARSSGAPDDTGACDVQDVPVPAPSSTCASTVPAAADLAALDAGELDIDGARDALSGALRSALIGAQGCARQVMDALADERAPRREDLDALAAFAGLLEDVHTQVESIVGPGVDAQVSAIVAAWEHVTAQLGASTARRERLVALARLQAVTGPAQLSDLLAELRALAADTVARLSQHAGTGASEDPVFDALVGALLALVALVDSADDPDADVMEATDLEDAARAGLPTRLRPVLTAAGRGRLVLPAADEVTVPEAADTGQASTDPTSDAGPHDDEPDDEPDTDGPPDGNGPDDEDPPGPDHPLSDATGDTTEQGSSGTPDASEDEVLASLLADLDTSALLTDATPPLPAQPAKPAGRRTTRPRPAADDNPRPAATKAPPEPADHVDTETLLQAQSACLFDGRYGLAGWAAAVAAAPAASVAIRRAAAFAAASRTATDQNSAAFLTTVSDPNAPAAGSAPTAADASPDAPSLKTLSDDPAGQLLGWAAAIRAGVVSPHPVTSALLKDLMLVVADHPPLTTLSEAFLHASYSGVYLTPATSRAVASVAATEQEIVALSDAARDHIDRSGNRTVKYALASEVWQALTGPDGKLRVLLDAVAEDDKTKIRAVRDIVVAARGRAWTSKLIDETARDVRRGSTKAGHIVAGARARLLDDADTVVALASDWVDAHDRLASLQAESGTREWMAGPLKDLRDAVATTGPAALDALDEIAASRHGTTGDDPAEDTELPLLAAAALAARALLEQTFNILDGHGPATDTAPELVANGGLLLAPAVRLHADTLEPVALPTPGDIVTAATDRDPEAAFAARADLGDHVGTGALVDLLRAHVASAATSGHDLSALADLADRLAAERAQMVQMQRAAAAAAEEALSTRVLVAWTNGCLTQDQWSALSARARALEPGRRTDFGVLAAAREHVQADLAAAIETAKEQMRQRLAARAGKGTVDAAASRIADRIDAGDLATAAELLEQAAEGADLSFAAADVDHLARFWPHVPAGLATAAATGSRPPLAWLVQALERGEFGPSYMEVAEALAPAFDKPLSQLPARRRNQVAKIVKAWLALAEGGPNKGTSHLTALKGVLSLAGYDATGENTQARRTGTQGRAWIELTGVQRVAGKSLVPALGSQMSPDGQSLRVLLVWDKPTPNALLDSLTTEPKDRTVFVLYFGLLSVDERRALADACRKRRKQTVVVIDDAVLAYLACQADGLRDTFASIVLPFSGASPYAPDVAGAVPEEMFYGRQAEIDEVMDLQTGSAAVAGGRQLGKTAMLRAAAQQFRNSDPDRKAVFLSIYSVGRSSDPASLWMMLWPELAAVGVLPETPPSPAASGAAPSSLAEDVCAGITAWLNEQTNRQLLILLDEADAFLDSDAADGKFPNVEMVRRLMSDNGRRVKVVFAGLHQTARFMQLSNQPLAHFGTPVSIGSLEPVPAHKLLTRPLRAMGFTFAEETLPARILALANNSPALIQLFGAALLARMHKTKVAPGEPPRAITRDDVDDVWSDPGLQNQFRSRFEWTLNLDARYRVIAYAVALHAHTHGIDAVMSASDLAEECQRWWPAGFSGTSTDEFRGLLEECVNLGVLAVDTTAAPPSTPRPPHERGYAVSWDEPATPATGYRLRTPNVLRLLGRREDIEDTLLGAENLPTPESFDGALYRAPAGDGIARAPLTASQVSDLLALRNQARIVVGSTATGIEKTAAALEQAIKSGHVRGQMTLRRTRARGNELRNALAALDVGHLVVVHDVRGVDDPALVVRDVLEAAEAVQASEHAGGTRSVVVLADAGQAPAWADLTHAAGEPLTLRQQRRLGDVALVELRRYGSAGVRLWMAEESLPFQDTVSQEALLTATGGWPSLVHQVLEAAAQPLAVREDALALAEAVRERPEKAAAFVASVLGSKSVPPSAAENAWRSSAVAAAGLALCDLGGEETLEDFAEVLADVPGLSEDPAGHPLHPKALEAAGYASMRDVVEALRVLGVLAPTGAGKFRVEPVLAAAVAVMSA